MFYGNLFRHGLGLFCSQIVIDKGMGHIEQGRQDNGEAEFVDVVDGSHRQDLAQGPVTESIKGNE